MVKKSLTYFTTKQITDLMQTSYPKDKIKIMLMEGIHQNAVDTFHKFGYTNVDHYSKALPEDELIAKLQEGVQMIGIRSKTKMTKRVIEAADKLRVIGCFCIGTNQVDLGVAQANGVAVFNSPHSNTRSVAELVIAQSIMLIRRIPEMNWATQNKIWQKSAKESYELRGKTIGVIGYGNIGSQVSVLAEAVGLRVLYYDVAPKLPLGNAQISDSLDELLKTSDIVTLHVPADEGSANLMNADKIALMKKGSILLNLSRGNVVDLKALKDSLDKGIIKGASIDVYPKEPKSIGDTFETVIQETKSKNIILTPHIGGSTQEAQENIGIDAAGKLANYLDTGSTIGCITIPEVNLVAPKRRQTHRVLHIHKNVPGVMNDINSMLKENNINVLGQFLKTNEDIGYAVIDVAADASEEVLQDLKQINNTIKARMLY